MLPSTAACGDAAPPVGNSQLYMDSTGKLCVAATVVATATTTATAAATPPAVLAGTGKPLVIDLNSGLFVQPSIGGTPVSATAPEPSGSYVYTGAAWESVYSPFALVDGVNGRDMVATGNYMWNGASWDRLAGAAATGLKIQGAGTAGVNAGGVLSIQGITSGVAVPTTANLVQVAGTNVLNGGIAGSQAVGGIVAAGAAVTLGNYPVIVGARAATSEPSAVADGMVVPLQTTVGGRLATQHYSLKESTVRGSVVVTGTGAQTVIAATGSSLLNYITALQCSNTSAGAVTVTANDTATSLFIVPATGGTNITFPTPLVVAGSAAFTLTASGASTTTTCNAQGYKGGA